MSSSELKSVYFLTGASGVGKTTLMEELERKYTGINSAFLRFDSIAIPSTEEMVGQFGSIEKWQEAMTHQWIDKILKDYADYERVFFEGQVNLEFIVGGFKKHNFKNYKIILIDCGEEEMAHRINNLRDQPELFTQDMKNWLRFLRKQAQDMGIGIINTTKLSKDQVLAEFEKLI